MGEVPGEFERFCGEEFPRLVGALGLYVGDVFVAEELAQETLIRACKRWETVRELDSPGGWAHRVALNLANSHLRRKAAERRAQRRLEQQEVRQPPADVSVDLSVERVRAAVSGLPRRQRTAVVLRYFGGWSSAEVGELLEVSSDAVRALTSRAFTRLRDELGSEDPSEWEVSDVH